MTPQELKYSILGHAFTGKLCEQSHILDFTNVKTVSFDEPPFDIPETWLWSTLGLCSEMYTGNSISESIKSAKYTGLQTGYDYIATKDVSFTQQICYDNGVKIPYDEGFKIAHKDAVLMCIEGGSAGRKIGILDRDVCFGNKLCSFHAKGVDNKYLFYYLQSWLFKELFSGNMTGIIGGVSIKKLKEISIPIAPLSEQKRIVAKLEEILPLIDRYEAAWNKLEEFNKRFPEDMQKSILQLAIQGKLVEQRPEESTGEELFQQIQAEKQALIKAGKIKKEKPLPEITEDEIPFEIPDSWKWIRLSDVVTLENGDRSGKYPVESDYVPFGIPFFGAKDMDGRYMSFESVRYISEEKFNELGNGKLKDKDFICLLRGSVGKIAMFSADEKHNTGFICAQMVIVRSLLGELVDYLYVVMTSPYYYRFIESSTTGTAVRQLPAKKLGEIVVPLPPLAEQKRIVAKLEENLPLCDRLK